MLFFFKLICILMNINEKVQKWLKIGKSAVSFTPREAKKYITACIVP